MANQFQLRVTDVFGFEGREGTVISGQVLNGLVSVGESVHVVLKNGQSVICKVVSVVVGRKRVQEAAQGGKVGLLLSGVGKDDVQLQSLVTTE